MANLFSMPSRPGRELDTTIAKKANAKAKKTTATVKGGGGLLNTIDTIRAIVEKNLGQFKDEYIVIREESVLEDYISHSIDCGVLAIDTETTGLDPMQDAIVGICIYAPGKKSAYVPVHHRSFVTNEYVDNQLSVEFIRSQFERLNEANTKIIMFNACFDIRFMKNQIGVRLHCYWDCYLAARLLNDNEGPGNNNLKKLHQKYVLKGQGDAFRFDDLFKGVPFDLIPISTAYLYAAHDPIITYELYKFQEPFLDESFPDCAERGLTGVSWVFRNIEMPCVDVVADMEDCGVAFDMQYATTLHDKYTELHAQRKADVYAEIEKFSDKIAQYRASHFGCKLSTPINIDSATQIAILLYDVLECQVVDDKSPRGTGEDILTKLDTALTKSILAYRETDKLLSTYIDKLPTCVNPNDGRVHCKFNQYGADTGRMSSSDPNLQNIPSHNKDIRKMFVASPGYVLMSSDFSQQEPKCLAALCRADGDPQMYNTFMEGKDLYSEIASKAFNYPYEECKEFRPDGSTNKEGKARRTQAKSILLGVLYGRGVDSIAEQLHTTTQAATEIKESVFRGFPAIKRFEQESLDMAKTCGFVTTVCGRKRRLPVLTYPDYEFKWANGVAPDDDPLAFDAELTTEVPEKLCRKYYTKLSRARFGQKRKIFEEANAEGIWVTDNTKTKIDTTRQVVNARIQGSAADLTKLAMIKLYNDSRLRELGFRLLIPVHDEVIVECPEENMKECAELLAKTMSAAAEEILQMPIKCDVEITRAWYGDPIG